MILIDREKIRANPKVLASRQKLLKAQEAFRAHRAEHGDDIGLGTYKPSQKDTDLQTPKGD